VNTAHKTYHHLIQFSYSEYLKASKGTGKGSRYSCTKGTNILAQRRARNVDFLCI